MIDQLKKIFKGNFFRNVAVLASGTAAAQLIAIASSPLITRIYGPEAFGVLGVFLALVNIVTPAAALAYPIAIVLPKRKKNAKELIKLSIMLATFISILSLFFLLLTKDYLVNLFNITTIEPYILFLPLIILFGAFKEVSEQWLIRVNNFKIAAKVKFYHSFILYGSMIGIGLFIPIASVLVIIAAFGNLLNALMMVYYSLGKSLKIPKQEFSFSRRRLHALAKKYNDFPFYRAPQVIINATSQGLPILFLSIFFGPASAGFYSIGRTVLGMPTQLVSKAIGDVFYPKFNAASHDKKLLTPLITKTTFALSAIGIIPFGIVIVFGPPLFSMVFGDDWKTAGEYARWIAFWSYFAFLNRPSVRALPVLGAQRFHLIHEIASVILRIIALYVGFIVFNNDIIAIALFSITGVILNIYLISYSIRLSNKFDKNNK